MSLVWWARRLLYWLILRRAIKLGLRIIQEPTKMDFGFTFTAADPDGHRLRVFNPSQR